MYNCIYIAYFCCHKSFMYIICCITPQFLLRDIAVHCSDWMTVAYSEMIYP